MPKELIGVSYTTILSRGDDDLARELKRRLLLVDRITMNAGYSPAFLHPDIKWHGKEGVVSLEEPDLDSLVEKAAGAGMPVDLTGDLGEVEDSLTRIWALDVPSSGVGEACPLCWFDRATWETSAASAPETVTAVELLIKAIPQPSDKVPLEEILEFRRAEEVCQKFTRLRFWMRNIARRLTKQNEIEEELEELLFEYEPDLSKSTKRSQVERSQYLLF